MKALTKKNFRTDDLAAGREHVEAYVEFVHYVERIQEASTMPAQVMSANPERLRKRNCTRNINLKMPSTQKRSTDEFSEAKDRF